MKKIIYILLVALFIGYTASAQNQDSDYQFSVVKELKITPIKNQNRSSTCWSFSGIAFLESELLRMGKGEFDLSEMFVVHHNFTDKAEKYVRLHGFGSMGPGGSFYDVIYALKYYGAVPQTVMSGLNYGEEMPVHNELDEVAKAYADVILKNKNGKLTPVWMKGYTAVIDTYLGKIPEKFTYNGKEYTPKSFADMLGLNADDYVSLTSYTHHPFYSSFALEIEDNWRWGYSYNLPADELMQVFDNAINNGYTIAWGADVSEKGFTRNGVATVPDMNVSEMSGSDQARWLGLSQREREAEIAKNTGKPGAYESPVTQEMRQIAFDNYQTTDDHGMQIYGIAKDQTGKKYYMVKNSWGLTGAYKGIWYVSEAYAKYKTMNIVVHKNALPAAIKQKLGIK